MTINDTPTIHDVAIDALHHGYSIVPPAEDGSKRPDGRWQTYQQRLPTSDELAAWYHQSRHGIGVVCGAVSGNLEMLEFEGRAVDDDIHAQFSDLAAAAGLTELLDRITAGYLEWTPTGGLHLLYRVDGPIAGNTKLARRPATPDELAANPDDKIKVLIETRGEGGYVIVAPSHGPVHPAAGEWRLVSGGFPDITTITADERDQLHRLAHALDQTPAAAPVAPAGSVGPLPPLNGALRPGDEYNSQPDAPQRTLELLLAHGWTEVFRRGDDIHLRRPGKQIGTSAVLHLDGGILYVFSSSTTFETEQGLTPFAVYAVLEHGGDYSAAARALRPAGSHPQDFSDLIARPVAGTATHVDLSTDTQDDDPASTIGATWTRTPLDELVAAVANGTITQIQPDVGRYTGPTTGALWYRGRVNGLYGEPGKGKTMIAVAIAAQILRDGGTVAWIDLEEPAAGIIARLLDLGAPAAAIINRFAHYAPDEPIAYAAHILTELTDLAPELVVIDSTGEALALEGVKPNNDDEVATWFRTWPRRIANHTGAAVVVIDHVVKDENTRGLWPGGSQRKKAAINGSAFMVTPIHELGRGVNGRLKLTTSKDRSGWHRTGQKAAEFSLDASIHPPTWSLDGNAEETTGVFRPTVLMEKISRYLAEVEEPASKRGIEAAVKGNHKARATALDVLVDEGYVRRILNGQYHYHELIRPYSEATELLPSSDMEEHDVA